MPSILFQTVHRPDRSPSQRFRHELYASYLRKQGFDVSFSYLLEPRDDEVYYRPGRYGRKARIAWQAARRRIGELRNGSLADIVFVQREAFMLGTSWFERRAARRSRLMFDFDDAIWLPDVSGPNRSLGWLKNPRKIERIVRAAHTVLAGNAYLAAYARRFNNNVHVVPTTLDTGHHRPADRPASGRVTIGWTGSLTTSKYFHRIAPVLGRLRAKYGSAVDFKLVGDPTYRHDGLQLTGEPWRIESEVEDLHDMDIGIMPLPDDPWTRGKCGFKALQYMACGIPAVVSPVGVNTEIVEDGVNGLLASGDDQWYDALCRLIESPGLRSSLGRAGRRTVIERYSFQAWKDRYVELFREALA